MIDGKLKRVNVQDDWQIIITKRIPLRDCDCFYLHVWIFITALKLCKQSLSIDPFHCHLLQPTSTSIMHHPSMEGSKCQIKWAVNSRRFPSFLRHFLQVNGSCSSASCRALWSKLMEQSSKYILQCSHFHVLFPANAAGGSEESCFFSVLKKEHLVCMAKWNGDWLIQKVFLIY